MARKAQLKEQTDQSAKLDKIIRANLIAHRRRREAHRGAV